MSDLLHVFAAGESYVFSVSPPATAWMSARRCVDNLTRAAEIANLPVDTERVWQIRVLQLSVAQVIDALADRFGNEVRARIIFKPDARLQNSLGAMPAVKTSHARAAGFGHDSSAIMLIRNGRLGSGESAIANPFARVNITLCESNTL
jgi:hypothetical protein